MQRPTPKEFAIQLLTLMLPAIVAFVIFLMFIACAPVEEMYRVSGDDTYTIYNNSKGDMIEIPWNKEECSGYKRPYHVTQYNK